VKLTMTIDVDDTVDPTLTDPHEVAEDVVARYQEHQRVNPGPEVTFVSAEWDG
jgi:hypothetical protein